MRHFPSLKEHLLEQILSWITYLGVGIASILAFSFLWTRWLYHIFDTEGLAPHGFCLLWNPELVTLYVTSDTIIGLSYLFISIMLIYFVCTTHRAIPFRHVFLAFGTFIFTCGATHFLDIWTLWYANYWLAGVVKLMTAIASASTACILPPLVPKLHKLVGDAKASEGRRQQLEATHHNLEILLQKTRDLDQARTQFFANVSHELRTPLTLILGSIKNLADQVHSPDLLVAERNALTLLKNVNNLLDISRLEAGKMDLSYSQVDIINLLRICLAHFETLIQEHKIVLITDMPTMLFAQIDEAKIQRVSLNLLSNAFKFVPVGGCVQCIVRQENDQVAITVRDNGPGIPAEVRERIFERFQRGQEASFRNIEGTGLGLAIVQQFVELHGGMINVSDAPEGGAQFTVTLPLTAPGNVTLHPAENPLDELSYQTYITASYEAEPDFATVLSQDAASSLPRILIIEDNKEMAHFLAGILTHTYNLCVAFSGKKGLEKVLTFNPDLIVCDVMMPNGGGEQFVQQVRQQSQLSDIPIMMLSAQSDNMLRVQLLQEGAQDYLIKPFLAQELQARIENLVSAKKMRSILQQELTSKDQNLLTLVYELAGHKHKLQSTLEELERMNKLQTNFIAIVSHEFRTTLTSIQGFSELLLSQEFSLQEVKEYSTDINTDAHRLTRMINDLLDLERLKSTQNRLHLESTNINEILLETTERIRLMNSTCEVRLHLDEALPPLQADKDKIIQVMINLASNAVKYSPSGGEISINSSKVDTFVQVRIEDHGIGIPAEALEHIFEEYSRVGAEKSRYIKGTGLGLSIVREIIMQHRGRIWVESVEGEGSTFYFTLPLFPLECIANEIEI